MTRRQAIKGSIRHWTEDYKKLRMFGGDVYRFGDIFDSNDCDLCGIYFERGCKLYIYTPIRGRLKSIERCPLFDGKTKCSKGRKHPYDRVWRAWKRGDKKGFMAGRAALLKRLQRAYKRKSHKLETTNV